MTPKITKTKIKVDGMDCVGCAVMIDEGLENIEGIEKSTTSYAKSEVVVEYDLNKIKLEKILDTLKQSGYTTSIT